MVLFQLPHHFEALRCMAIERLWDGEQGREPMHHLMGDIMGYCRKAELTLGCPTEEILVYKELSGDFVFMDDGIVYEISPDPDDKVKLCMSAVGTDERTILYNDASEDYIWRAYYNPDVRKLYLLCNDGEELLEHDMASGKTGEPIMIPHLTWRGSDLASMIVIDDRLYVGMELLDEDCDPKGIEVLLVRLSKPQEVRLIYTVTNEEHQVDSQLLKHRSSFIGFTAVPHQPQAIDIFYELKGIWHSVRIDIIRSDNPMLFSARIDEGVKRRKIRLPRLLSSHPRGLRRVATIDKAGRDLFRTAPIVFSRWSFSIICKSGPGRSLIRFHPYLS
ncbi:hypothetical protein FOZ60_001178 [Perkinsus olseni]|uniref:Uncharacterized protein n=1 Tax=Perkinsus olseni TaxID=32597 RepID=A0A7J6P372_PEROL|nr:hypothetical protein FOZ60_001178 [Perkinsus olseni]